MGDKKEVTVRDPMYGPDREQMKEAFESNGFFYDFELEVANSMVDDYFDGEPTTVYRVAEVNGKVVGVTMFGRDSMSKLAWTLYWISVHGDYRDHGVGRALMEDMEKQVSAAGGGIVYIETSARELYLPTRMFYLHNKYSQEALLKDYYARGDGKCIFSKEIS